MGRGGSKSNATSNAGCMTTYICGISILKWVLGCKFHISMGIKLKDAARLSLHPTEVTGTSSSWHALLATWILSLLPPRTGCPGHHLYLMATSHPKHLTYLFAFYSKSWWASKQYRGQCWGLSGFTAFIQKTRIDLPKTKIHDRAGPNASKRGTMFLLVFWGFMHMNNILDDSLSVRKVPALHLP